MVDAHKKWLMLTKNPKYFGFTICERVHLQVLSLKYFRTVAKSLSSHSKAPFGHNSHLIVTHCLQSGKRRFLRNTTSCSAENRYARPLECVKSKNNINILWASIFLKIDFRLYSLRKSDWKRVFFVAAKYMNQARWNIKKPSAGQKTPIPNYFSDKLQIATGPTVEALTKKSTCVQKNL
jgi:hypothetical protein